MFSFEEKVDKCGINRITYQKGRGCQKAMRHIITTLQTQQFVGTTGGEVWPETQAKSSLK
jgi:hypothetical protein